MKKTKPTVAVTIALLCAEFLLGVQPARATPIRGIGTNTCAEYLVQETIQNPSAEDTALHLQRGQWLLGFFSAYNHYLKRDELRADPYANGIFPPEANVEEMIDDLRAICQKNPKQLLYHAATVYVAQQVKKQKAAKGEPATTPPAAKP